jgi:hypothetical protein
LWLSCRGDGRHASASTITRRLADLVGTDARTRRQTDSGRGGIPTQTVYNDEHFFVPNEIGRYSVGTKNTDLEFARDGSLTIHVQVDAPTDPRDGDFSL